MARSLHNLHDVIENADLPASGKAFKTPSGHLFGWGPTVPADTEAGWAIGALFLHTDGAAGTALYCNEGTAGSCDFDAVSVG
jgi:hypothetical protein